MRVLVTGSQLWNDREFIWGQLDALLDKHGAIILVHGDCPNGADAHAADWAGTRELDGHPVRAEPHPAKWRKNGKLDKSAGFRRNAEMVKLGADLCLAFILDESSGSTHTAKLAKKAGIKTIVHARSTTPMTALDTRTESLPPYVYKRVNDELQLLGVRLMWRNFAGEKKLYNETGKRQFAIPMDMETALQLREIGWNVRDNEAKVKAGLANDLMFHLDVTVKMDGKVMPRIFMISKKWSEAKQEQVPMRTQLDEELVGMLDWAEFDNVDLILRPFNWDVSGKKGVKAYLKTLYATLHQDPLDEMYAHIPIEGADELRLEIEAPDDILDVEVIAEWDDVEIADNGRLALERGRS